jgi:hypothetical protein
MALMRLVIHALSVGAVLCGIVSAMLHRKKVLALTGILLALLANFLGGASVPINKDLHNGSAIGLENGRLRLADPLPRLPRIGKGVGESPAFQPNHCA